jgi:hypothetical protein
MQIKVLTRGTWLYTRAKKHAATEEAVDKLLESAEYMAVILLPHKVTISTDNTVSVQWRALIARPTDPATTAAAAAPQLEAPATCDF